MDKTFQRGDLMKYGVLVKVVPVHWGKDKELNKNTISCWYRPGFRWSPERGQSVVPRNLNLFKVGYSVISKKIDIYTILSFLCSRCCIKNRNRKLVFAFRA